MTHVILIVGALNVFFRLFGSTRMMRMHSERSSRKGGLFRMETQQKYREFAEECERLAKQANSDHHRKALQEMAEVWRNLAEAVDKRT